MVPVSEAASAQAEGGSDVLRYLFLMCHLLKAALVLRP